MGALGEGRYDLDGFLSRFERLFIDRHVALIIVDAVVRRLPGVLHNSESADNDSFTAQRGGGRRVLEYERAAGPAH